jgi:hypothetical protein
VPYRSREWYTNVLERTWSEASPGVYWTEVLGYVVSILDLRYDDWGYCIQKIGDENPGIRHTNKYFDERDAKVAVLERLDRLVPEA